MIDDKLIEFNELKEHFVNDKINFKRTRMKSLHLEHNGETLLYTHLLKKRNKKVYKPRLSVNDILAIEY